jgi:transposase
MRRVDCPRCGVVVERVPWADGKHRLTHSFAHFLARWAKRLSWQEVAEAFQTSWDTVFRAVERAVAWGLAHRELSGITAIGIDEVLWQRGYRFLTVVYELTAGRRRLLWIGREREEATLHGFFDWLGDRVQALRFICSDMWKPYLKVIGQRAAQAVHVLDRFHIVARMNQAIDEVRAKEAKLLRAQGYEPILKRTRWLVLKRPEHLTEKQEPRLADLLRFNLRTVRAYLLKEDFQAFWEYVSPAWAGKFLDRWCRRTMRSRLEPMKKIAASLRAHRELILNWFRARKEISAAAVEGLNGKLKLVTRRAYGFRGYRCLEVALYHALGDLPEPPATHRFC